MLENKIHPFSKTVIIIIFSGLLIFAMTVALHTFVTSRVQFGIDFYVYWLAGEEMFLEGGNPYSEDVSLRAQLGILGRQVEPHEHQHPFLNPPYSLLAILPTVWMTYPWAIAFWTALNVIGVLVVARLSFPHMPVWVLAVLPFLYPFARSVFMGQFSLFIFVIMLAVHGIIVERENSSKTWLLFSGLLLAWTTGKPQLSGLLIIFYLLVSLNRRYWAVCVGFLVGLFTFFLMSFFWIEDWPLIWLSQTLDHADIMQPDIWIIGTLKWVMSVEWAEIVGVIIVLVATVFAVYLTDKWLKGQTSVILVLAWFVLISALINPFNRPPDQVVLFIPLLAWIHKAQHSKQILVSLVWTAAILLPWLGFSVTFTGHESESAWIITPLLYSFWVLSITLIKRIHPCFSKAVKVPS
jgi:hypothetical protein